MKKIRQIIQAVQIAYLMAFKLEVYLFKGGELSDVFSDLAKSEDLLRRVLESCKEVSRGDVEIKVIFTGSTIVLLEKK